MGNNIYLIGFMGAGKSAVAKQLSAKLDIPLIEMDQEIVRRAGKEITEIFAECGEEGFRDMETNLLFEIAEGEPSVVSCGGGAVLRTENVKSMRESGMTVLLLAKPETIFERVRYSSHRPLLNGRMNVEAISELMEARRPAYEAACQFKVETDGKRPGEIADGIIALRELRS